MSADTELRTPPDPAARPRHLLRVAVAVVVTTCAAVVALPDLLGLDRTSPFAQVVAFRHWALLGVAILALLVALTRSGRPLAVGLLAVVLVGATMVVPRLVATAPSTEGRALTVLTVNTYFGNGDPAAVAELIRSNRPDAVAIVEAGEPFYAKLAPQIADLGYGAHISKPGAEDVLSNVMLLAEGLGDVRVTIGRDTALFPYLEATGGGLGELRFVAFHTISPSKIKLENWVTDLQLLARWCAGPTPAIVAGDLNATLDHSALRSGMAGCTDAGEQRGSGLTPTWSPSPQTRPFGPQIDHVLATEGIAAETFSVHFVEKSDHAAVLTRLRIPA
ncbi:endonuclease/exonuclease/phosphatase family protein [Actinomycetes bacterium KLBMP 9759]